MESDGRKEISESTVCSVRIALRFVRIEKNRDSNTDDGNEETHPRRGRWRKKNERRGSRKHVPLSFSRISHSAKTAVLVDTLLTSRVTTKINTAMLFYHRLNVARPSRRSRFTAGIRLSPLPLYRKRGSHRALCRGAVLRTPRLFRRVPRSVISR